VNFFLKGKHQASLVISVFLFAAVLPWFTVLRILLVMSEVLGRTRFLVA
jgi:hypothetical protein